MTLIYKPQGRAQEYGSTAVNTYTGCSFGCRYCYCPLVLKKNRVEFHDAKPRASFTIERFKLELQTLKDLRSGKIFFCFSCDPYQPLEEIYRTTGASLEAIRAVHRMHFNVLTKNPGLALKLDGDAFTRMDAIGTTLTTMDTKTALEWEPFAPEPASRAEGLRRAYQRGIQTWVSLEPIVSIEETLRVIEATHEFSTHYKIGAPNYLNTWPPSMARIARSNEWQTSVRMIRRTLAGYGFKETATPGKVIAGTYYLKESLKKYT